MPSLPDLALAAAAAFAVLSLAEEARSARAERRAHRAQPSGSGLRGVLYGFTGAMLPGRKESISRHPLSFAAGILLHAGVLASLAGVGLAASFPAAIQRLRSPLLAFAAGGLAACLGLLVRRLTRAELRRLSVPDDYAASVALALFLAASVAFHLEVLPGGALEVLAALLLVYLPLGKLRHAVFFFLARGNLARRLGERGVFPPARGREIRDGRG